MRENLRKTVCLLLLFMLAVSVVFLAVSCKKADKAEKEEAKVDYGPSIPPEKTAKVTWAGCRRSD